MMYSARFFENVSIEGCLSLAARERIERPVWDGDKSLYLYGRGRLAADFLVAVGHPKFMVLDQHRMWGVETGARVAVAEVTSPYVPIERALLERGFYDVVPFYDFAQHFCGQHPLADNGWFAEPLTSDEILRTMGVLYGWDDDISRAHHLQFIAWRRIREEWTFEGAPVSTEDQYFIPEVVAVLHNREVFLDGGAYHGDTLKRFIEVTHGEFARLFAVEPDSENLEKLARRILPTNSTFALIGEALGARSDVAFFYDSFGCASRIGDGGKATVSVRTIDSLGIAPTFIKLHLEGGELAALKGGLNRIRKHRPIIAATVYHNADGIYRTAEWLMENLEDYRFLFRNHCWQGTGAVLYAIPCERNARRGGGGGMTAKKIAQPRAPTATMIPQIDRWMDHFAKSEPYRR